MGWKNIKTHFKINHLGSVVQMQNEDVVIGSKYDYEVIRIKPDGSLRLSRAVVWPAMWADYIRHLGSDPALVAKLINDPDHFDSHRLVWIIRHDNLLVDECRCEEFGWPNVTHCGRLMFHNTAFETYGEAIAESVLQLQARRGRAMQEIDRAKQALTKWEQEFQETDTSLDIQEEIQRIMRSQRDTMIDNLSLEGEIRPGDTITIFGNRYHFVYDIAKDVTIGAEARAMLDKVKKIVEDAAPGFDVVIGETPGDTLNNLKECVRKHAQQPGVH